MNNLLTMLQYKFQELTSREEGQDLVEYALIIALVSVALIVALPQLATAITAAFTAIEADL